MNMIICGEKNNNKIKQNKIELNKKKKLSK